MEVLVVCTANVSRSVMLQAFLGRRLGEQITVRTAGVLPGGRPVDPTTAEVLAAHGFDVAGHASSRIDRPTVRQADLVVCLERRHVREVVVVDRDAFGRTFTVRELVRRAESAGPRADGEPLADWVAGLHRGRDLAHLATDAPDDDVADPTGGPLAAYEHTAQWLDALAGRLVSLAFPHGAGDEDAPPLPSTATPLGPLTVEPERWEREGAPTVGLIADRSGLRLARSVRASLQVAGYGRPADEHDRWVTSTWGACASSAASLVAGGAVDVVVSLTESGTSVAALANRRRGVRALAASDGTAARRARRRWGANVLCLGIDEVTAVEAIEIVQVFVAQQAVVAPELDDLPFDGPAGPH